MAMKFDLWKRKAWEFYWIFGGKYYKKTKKIKGWYGEWRACTCLRNKKYKILHRNWRSSTDNRREIDLICKDHEVLVFVEVRARSSNSLTNGFFSISAKKKKTLSRGGRDFLSMNFGMHDHYRFDVVEIDLDGKKNPLYHHQNVSVFP